MSATNHTPNLNLSIFEPTDTPSWQEDWNDAMNKLDSAAGGGTPVLTISMDEYKAWNNGDAYNVEGKMFYDYLQAHNVPTNTDYLLKFVKDTVDTYSYQYLNIGLDQTTGREPYLTVYVGNSPAGAAVYMHLVGLSVDSQSYYLQNGTMYYVITPTDCGIYRMPSEQLIGWDADSQMESSGLAAKELVSSLKKVMGALANIEGVSSLQPTYNYWGADGLKILDCLILQLDGLDMGDEFHFMGELIAVGGPTNLLTTLQNGSVGVYFIDKNGLPATGNFRKQMQQGQNLKIYTDTTKSDYIEVSPTPYWSNTYGEQQNDIITSTPQTQSGWVSYSVSRTFPLANYNGSWYFIQSSQSISFKPRTLTSTN